MTLTPAEVDHVAALARLALDEEERVRITAQLGAILDHVSRLQGVNTSAVVETIRVGQPVRVGQLVNVWRDDLPAPSLGAELALRGAPDRVGDHFRVGAIQE